MRYLGWSWGGVWINLTIMTTTNDAWTRSAIYHRPQPPNPLPTPDTHQLDDERLKALPVGPAELLARADHRPRSCRARRRRPLAAVGPGPAGPTVLLLPDARHDVGVLEQQALVPEALHLRDVADDLGLDARGEAALHVHLLCVLLVGGWLVVLRGSRQGDPFVRFGLWIA